MGDTWSCELQALVHKWKHEQEGCPGTALPFPFPYTLVVSRGAAPEMQNILFEVYFFA